MAHSLKNVIFIALECLFMLLLNWVDEKCENGGPSSQVTQEDPLIEEAIRSSIILSPNMAETVIWHVVYTDNSEI